MDPLTALLIAGGGAVVYKQVTDKNGNTSIVPQSVGTADDAEKRRRLPLASVRAPGLTRIATPGTAVYDPVATTTKSQSWYSPKGIIQSIPSEVENEVLKRAKAEYEKLSSEAKKAACKKLKESFPDSDQIQGLDCNASFDKVYQVCVAALGASAAAAATGVCGPPCGALALMATTYLGVKVEDWVNDAYSKIEGYTDDVKDWAEDKYDDVVDFIGDYF